MRVMRAFFEDFTDSVIDDIAVFMDWGFALEIPRRKFSPDRFRTVLRAMFDSMAVAAYLVLDECGRCEGVFVGIVSPDIVTDDILGTQIVWRVSKRGKGHGMIMLKAFVDWCEQNAVTRVVVAGGHGELNKRKLGIKLRLLGFEPAVENWMRGI